MPEHTLPDALHPQQEDAADELQLRGGLKGRFFADFCLLQSTVDALQNYLVHAATPDVQDMAAPLLEEMKQRIFRDVCQPVFQFSAGKPGGKNYDKLHRTHAGIP